MADKVETSEEPASLDISNDVIGIIDDPNVDDRTSKLDDYLRSLRNEPSLSLTMDWRGLGWAR